MRAGTARRGFRCWGTQVIERVDVPFEDCQLDLDVSSSGATIQLSGTLRLRSATALRVVLDALDGLLAPVRICAADVRFADEHVAFVIDEASRRRHALGLAGLMADAASASALGITVPLTDQRRP